jgi:hypothetical protein
VAFLMLCVWCSFNVQLGSGTFANHMDRIGQTREAEELLDGTRTVVDPMMEEARDRLLGEYIEAPTTAVPPAEEEGGLPRRAGPPALPGKGRRFPRNEEDVHASMRAPRPGE